MSRHALIIAALVATGCAEVHGEPTEESVEVAHLEEDANVIRMHCVDHTDLAPSCGLLVPHVSTPDFRSYFREKRCVGRSEEECLTLFDRDVDLSLGKRYWAANRNAIARKCASAPVRCNDGRALETELLTSHNRNVLKGIRQRMMTDGEPTEVHAVDPKEAAEKALLLVAVVGSVHRAHY